MRIAFFLVTLLILGAEMWRLRCCLVLARRAARAACEGGAAAQRDAAASVRLLREMGSELREQGLAMLGQSELCPAAERVERAATAARLLAIADDLQDHAPPSPESRVLVRELIGARALLESCVEAVAANLRPSVRLWRLAPDLDTVSVYGDRRALTQVLLRVLCNAARTTHHLDWIEIGAVFRDGQVVLIVEDEGSGALPARGGSGAATDAPGLAVARSLVQAHGGDLCVEQVAGVGARVEVALPAFQLEHDRRRLDNTKA